MIDCKKEYKFIFRRNFIRKIDFSLSMSIHATNIDIPTINTDVFHEDTKAQHMENENKIFKR